MTIEYLLSAYRRLENASNRRMTDAHEAALEEAISDIQLLGSPKQVDLATSFARQFADDQRAPTEPLLEDLRGSLRKELGLDNVPPRRMWLRIDHDPKAVGGPTVVDESWATWEQQKIAVGRSLTAAWRVEQNPLSEPASQPDLSGASPFVRELVEMATSNPIGVVVRCEQQIADELARLLGAHGEDIGGLNVAEMAHLALDRSIINEATRNGIEGLRVMHTMAMLDDGGRRLTERQAIEYVGLTEGLLLALRLAR